VAEDVDIMPGVGISATISIRTKNIGRSPAIGAIETVEMLMDDRGGDRARQAAQMCQRAISEKEALVGIEGAMFPDTVRETRYSRVLSRLPESPSHARIAIVGCTTYALPAGPAVGYTAFIYTLARNCGTDTITLPCDFDLNVTATFRGDQVATDSAPFAGFAR
jgi:hypothetical protein